MGKLITIQSFIEHVFMPAVLIGKLHGSFLIGVSPNHHWHTGVEHTKVSEGFLIYFQCHFPKNIDDDAQHPIWRTPGII